MKQFLFTILYVFLVSLSMSAMWEYVLPWAGAIAPVLKFPIYTVIIALPISAICFYLKKAIKL